MSYSRLREGSKTHFKERHMFKPSKKSMQFKTSLAHHFNDCMAAMKTDIVHVMVFDTAEFNQHYAEHLEKPAKTRINMLLESNYYPDHNGCQCK